MSDKKMNINVFLCIGMACLQFVLLLLIPLSNIEGTKTQQMIAYIIAFLFWTSLIGEIVFVRLSSNERKRLDRKLHKGKEINQSFSGIFSFLKNKEAMIADITLFLSVILLGIIIWTNVKTSWMIIGDVAFLALSFNLHCILNGKNYRYLKEIRTTRMDKIKKGEKKDE